MSENETRNETRKRSGGRKTKVGIVTSNKMNKTIIVKVQHLVKHPVYGKYTKRWTKYWAHDEDNIANIGDRVLLMETRPLSKKKRWRLVSILEGPEKAQLDKDIALTGQGVN